MSRKFTNATASRLAVAGLILIGGTTAAITANADTGAPSSTPSATSTASSTAHDDHCGPGGHHTAVTGAERTRVVAAVKAKDPAVTVTDVRKDADSSYDVHGTKAGKKVVVEVSKDLTTVEVRSFDPMKGGHRRHGHHHGTEVTGAELARVKAAVVAKNADVTVEHVMKDPNGSYHVMATKSGTRVVYKVSKDLKTITVDTHRPRDGRGPQDAPGSTATKPA